MSNISQSHMLKWHHRYMAIASEVKTWSKDPSTKVGAVVVGIDGQILSTGYNGFPRQMEDREEWLTDREEKYKRIIHAELNCLYNASLTGISLKNSTLYVDGLPPCSKCALGIIQSGITCVGVNQKDIDNLPERWKEDCEFSINILTSAGVRILKI